MRHFGDFGQRLAKICLILLALMTIGAEVGARSVRAVDFPLYARAPGVEYFPAPNQSGIFLWRTHWYVNDKGFDNRETFEDTPQSCMLVGDSVVYGGNPVDYEDRIGQIAESVSGHRIWVAAAGGWNLLNELAFLDLRHQELATTQHLVFILNNGDFGGPGAWGGEYVFPTERPALATPYLMERYLLPHMLSELPPIVDAIDPGMQQIWQHEMDGMLASYRHPVTILLYADQNDFLNPEMWARATEPIRRYAQRHADRITLIDIPPLWSLDLYRDAVHPNVHGNRIIARLVAAACSRNPATATLTSDTDERVPN